MDQERVGARSKSIDQPEKLEPRRTSGRTQREVIERNAVGLAGLDLGFIPPVVGAAASKVEDRSEVKLANIRVELSRRLGRSEHSSGIDDAQIPLEPWPAENPTQGRRENHGQQDRRRDDTPARFRGVRRVGLAGSVSEVVATGDSFRLRPRDLTTNRRDGPPGIHRIRPRMFSTFRVSEDPLRRSVSPANGKSRPSRSWGGPAVHAHQADPRFPRPDFSARISIRLPCTRFQRELGWDSRGCATCASDRGTGNLDGSDGECTL